MQRNSNGTLSQIETVYVVSSSPLQLQNRARISLPGQKVRGNVIGPLVAASWTNASQTWQLKLSDKKKVLGSANFTQCSDADNDGQKPKASDVQPAFFFESPEAAAMELLHSLGATSVVDLSCGSGHFAMTAIRNRIPFLGVCLTNAHMQALSQRLTSRVLTLMTDANEKALYDAGLAASMQQAAKEQGDEPTKGNQKNPKAKSKPKAAPAADAETKQDDGANEGEPSSSRADLLNKIGMLTGSGVTD